MSSITEKFTHQEKLNICLALNAQVRDLDASMDRIATSDENLSGHSLQAIAHRALSDRRNQWEALLNKVHGVLVEGK